MASHFLQLNDRISQGEGAPADGDALCTSTSLFPVGAIYIDNNTGILYARNTANGNAADWVSQSEGTPGIDDVLAEAQTLTAARVVDLNGNTFQVKSGGNDFLLLDAPNFSSRIMAEDVTATATITAAANSAANNVDIELYTDAGGVDYVEIIANGETGNLSIDGTGAFTYSADTHTFTGQSVFNGVQEFADNAAAITGGLATGAIYRTGDVLKIVH